jgi:surface polysaccharide O-acyltransferase-like enzyme
MNLGSIKITSSLKVYLNVSVKPFELTETVLWKFLGLFQNSLFNYFEFFWTILVIYIFQESFSFVRHSNISDEVQINYLTVILISSLSVVIPSS